MRTKYAGLDGKLTAFPITLPAGPVGFVVGGEWRHESLEADIDPQTYLGSVNVANINAGRDVAAGFAELSIPVVSQLMKVPGIRSLDLDAAVRYEKYNPGDSAWVPKVGFVVRPNEDVALRGTFSKSFISPDLYQTNGPSVAGQSAVVDLGAGPEQAQIEHGANPLLGNVRADTYTGGVVLSPHQVPGLTFNGDFFHEEETGLVGNFQDAAILTSVNALGRASPYAGLVHLGSFSGPEVTAPEQLVGNLPLYYVVSNLTNIGGVRIGGVDFGANYTHNFGTCGTVNLGVSGTYYLQYKIQSFNFSNYYDIIGYYGSEAGDVQQYHLTPLVSYTVGGFTVSAIGNYIPSMRDVHQISIDPTPGLDGVNPDKPSSILNSQEVTNTNGTRFQDHLPKIRDYFTVDLLLSYEFRLVPTKVPAATAKTVAGDGKGSSATFGGVTSMRLLDGLKLTFGIENLSNARPPFIQLSEDSSNTDASIYDPYQRQYYFVVTKKF